MQFPSWCNARARRIPLLLGLTHWIKPSSWVWSMENIEVVWDDNIWKRWKYVKVISQGVWMFLAGATTAVHGANSSRCECSTHGYTTCSICPAANEVGSVTELWAKLNRTMCGVLWRLLSIIWLSDIICILSAYLPRNVTSMERRSTI